LSFLLDVNVLISSSTLPMSAVIRCLI